MGARRVKQAAAELAGTVEAPPRDAAESAPHPLAEVTDAQRAADLGSLNAAGGPVLEVPRLTSAAGDADAPQDAPPPPPLLDVEGYFALGEVGLGLALGQLGSKAKIAPEVLAELQHFSEQEKALLRPLLERAAPYLDTWMGNLTPQHAAIGCALVYGWCVWQRLSAIKALAAALERQAKGEQRAAPVNEASHMPPAPPVDASHIPGSPY